MQVREEEIASTRISIMREESKQRLAHEAEIHKKTLEAIIDEHNAELKILWDESGKRVERADEWNRIKIQFERDESTLRKVLLERWEAKKQEILEREKNSSEESG